MKNVGYLSNGLTFLVGPQQGANLLSSSQLVTSDPSLPVLMAKQGARGAAGLQGMHMRRPPLLLLQQFTITLDRTTHSLSAMVPPIPELTSMPGYITVLPYDSPPASCQHMPIPALKQKAFVPFPPPGTCLPVTVKTMPASKSALVHISAEALASTSKLRLIKSYLLSVCGKYLK